MIVIKERITVICKDFYELKECLRKLIEFGFQSDEYWNEEMMNSNLYDSDIYAIWFSTDSNTVQIHNHDCDEEIQIKYSELEDYLSKIYK